MNATRGTAASRNRGEQEPRRIHFSGRAVEVLEILDRWIAPDHRYFKLRGDDGAIYIVRHDEAAGVWQLTLFDGRGRGPSEGGMGA